ncbi:protein TSSC1-like [Limulus polyphemus]|uniref:Protein TSSC1-like n=1 Tax=Limulus polyphemus TaxID=6850 RepID=A0ABM1RZI6_LIMPO|nr:protein TSSC1-like [Limulus polyphemus]
MTSNKVTETVCLEGMTSTKFTETVCLEGMTSDKVTETIVGTGSADIKGKPQINAASWNPHQNCNLVAAAVDTSVRGWDLRTMQQSWVIESAHGQLVRELDFNPNRQYFLVTCGDDCHTKFWDIRSPDTPVLVQSHHSHW